MLSKSAMLAYLKGYRAIEGRIISPSGNERKLEFSGGKDCYTYPCFKIRYEGRIYKVYCHQLVAWEKFSKECVGKDVIVRHKDDNPFNFKSDNIELGTRSDNETDKIFNKKVKNENEN